MLNVLLGVIIGLLIALLNKKVAPKIEKTFNILTNNQAKIINLESPADKIINGN